MKSLQQFILEQTENTEEKKSFSFDLTDIDETDKFIEELQDKEGVTIEDKKVTIEVTKGQAPKILETIKSNIKSIREQQKNYSDESYAQKTKKLEDTLKQLEEFTKEQETSKEDDKTSKEEE